MIKSTMFTLTVLISVSAGAQNLGAWYTKALDLGEKEKIQVPGTVVAVLDTGVDINHPALKNSIWTNPGETGKDAKGRDKATNGIDDDGNGYIDDVHGWNFAANSPSLKDDHGHGTHIAGLISANSPEFKGIAPGSKVMVLKYFDPKAPGGGNLMNTVRAIKYALLMGATVINYSGGGPTPHPLEKAVLLEAQKKNVLIVAAAGNDSTDADVLGFYPASYNLSHILSVTSVGADLKRVPSSNWGQKVVKIAAPGELILSSLPNLEMGYMTGTSQATALMSGLALLLKAKRPELKKPEEIIRILTSTGKYNENLVGLIHNPIKASAKRALSMAADFSSEERQALSSYTP